MLAVRASLTARLAPRDRAFPLALLALLSFALVLRLWALDAESAWIDEAYSITLAGLSIPEIIQGTAADQHPPLYYLLLHIWMLLGSSVPHARLLSVLIGVFNVGQVAVFGRRLAGEWVGLVAALLVSVSPMHIWYSQEVRMYILLAALTTAASAVLWSCLGGARRWLLYTVLALLSLYTHNFAAFILLAHAGIVLAWAVLQRSRQPLLAWTGAAALAGLGYLPWVPVALHQVRFHTMAWISVPEGMDVGNILLRLILGSAVLALPGAVRALLLTAVLALTYAAILYYRRQRPEGRQGFLFLAIWAGIPFLAVTAISLVYPIFQFKQFLIILAPILLAVAWLARRLPHALAVPLLAAVLLSSTASSVYQHVTLNKDDWRGIAAYIQEHSTPDDVVYGNPAASSLALSLYWGNSLPVDGYPPDYDILTGGWEGTPVTAQAASQELDEAFVSQDRIWLVEFVPWLWDPGAYIEAWLGRNAELLDDQRFDAVRVRLYERTSEQTADSPAEHTAGQAAP